MDTRLGAAVAMGSGTSPARGGLETENLMQMRLLLLGLAVMCLAGPVAAETWKWRDDIGRLAYSNVKGTAPAAAQVLSGEIGFIGGGIEAPPPEKAEAPEAAAPAEGRMPSAAEHGPEPLAVAGPYLYRPLYQWWWHDYQVDDPIATELWLYKAETALQLRRWGFGS